MPPHWVEVILAELLGVPTCAPATRWCAKSALVMQHNMATQSFQDPGISQGLQTLLKTKAKPSAGI